MYLAVVQLLDDVLVLLADVAHADELGFPVPCEEAGTEPLDYTGGRAARGHRAILYVPEHTHWRQTLLGATVW